MTKQLSAGRWAFVLLVLLLLTNAPAVVPGSAAGPAATVTAGKLRPAQAPQERFTILVSNDDGYDAPGLRALIEALAPLGDIYVSAPLTNQSGKGHSIITSYDPIFISERKQPNGVTWYAVEAPPATCVRVAIEALLPRRPDLVVSGINPGDNVGISVYLSGTLGAAREAALVGIPAIAISQYGGVSAGFAPSAAFARRLVEELRAQNLLKPGFFLNVNMPAGEPKGARVARMSLAPSNDSFERRASPRGRVYFWSKYRPPEGGAEGTDAWAVSQGYVALTPLRTDETDTQAMDALRSFEKHKMAP